MNVLHVHSGNMFGGVERMLQAMAPATAGRTPVSSSFALCFDGSVSKGLRAADAIVHQLGPVHARRIGEVLAARRRLRRLLNAEPWSAALVHSAWSQAIFGPTILSSGVPLVRWLHSPQPGPRWLELWASRCRPALVLCNSQYTRIAVADRLGSVPVGVQYPPASLHPVRPGNRAAVRAALGTPDDAVVVALAARIEAGKGHALLIDALARLDNSRWEAWIIGGVQQPPEQTDLDALRQQAENGNIAARVRFLGQRADVPELLDAADVYCQPNYSPDSFGLSFVEALAAGLPVITTRMGAAAEIVDRTCGLLVAPGSIAELTDALSRMIGSSDERRAMSAAARIRGRSFCDLPGSMQQLANELARVITTAPVLT